MSARKALRARSFFRSEIRRHDEHASILLAGHTSGYRMRYVAIAGKTLSLRLESLVSDFDILRIFIKTRGPVQQMKKHRSACLTITALLIILGCGCGNSKGPSGPTSISSQQAVAAATQIGQTFVAASAQMGASFCGNPFAPQEQFPCTISIAASVPCNEGGTVAVSGANNGDLDYSNTGPATGTLTFTTTNCSIPGSTLVMNGTPGLPFATSTFYFYGGVSSFTAVETGSISYGPNPAGVCQTNLTITASFEGNNQHTVTSCTLTGTACGQPINQQCQ